MDNKYTVIKCGGSTLNNLSDSFFEYVKNLWEESSSSLLFVHGGGPAIREQERLLGISSEFVNGLRQTSTETMRVVKQILNGEINSDLVLKLRSKSIDALGLSGIDGSLLEASFQDKATLGYVGAEPKVNMGLLKDLLNLNKLLVISSLAVSDVDGGVALNINADIATLAIAKSLQAKQVIFVTDVAGVLDNKNNVIRELKVRDAQNFMVEGVISGGMVPKIRSCIELLDSGIGEVKIVKGNFKGNFSDNMGTVISY